MRLLIKSDKAIAYAPKLSNGLKSAKQIANEANLRLGRSNELTKNARRRLLSNVDSFMAVTKAAGRPMTFITLTLPSIQEHDDKFLNRHCLERMLHWLHEECGAILYLWRAETQANGNIHWHILTDTYIDNRISENKQVGKLTRKWNEIIAKHGYIDRYSERIYQRYRDGLLSAAQIEYGMANNWNQPNSCDVQAIANASQGRTYIAKYISKGDDSRRPVDSRQWGCTDRLKSIGQFTLQDEGKVYQAMQCLADAMNTAALKVTYKTENDFSRTPPRCDDEWICTIYQYDSKDIDKVLGLDTAAMYRQYFDNWSKKLYIFDHENIAITDLRGSDYCGHRPESWKGGGSIDYQSAIGEGRPHPNGVEWPDFDA